MLTEETLIAFARQAVGLPESAFIGLSPLGGRGSDRTFFRLTWAPRNSAILIHYDPQRIENAYYGDIATFLREIDVPVPTVMLHNAELCLMVLEDLGNDDLWTMKDKPKRIRTPLYEQTLVVVHRLHSFPVETFPANRVRLMEGFGPPLYRWERDYFMENFVKAICRIDLKPEAAGELETELSDLAGRLALTGPSLVHRDLQSQNVMIRDGEPFLIDFQGMRFGSPYYDLGSLLYDPYVYFSNEERSDLLAFYYHLSERPVPLPVFQEHFYEASVQRLMQALGAYGFLGLTRGLGTFLEHIPAGLRNLQDAASRLTTVPRLLALSKSCQEAIATP